MVSGEWGLGNDEADWLTCATGSCSPGSCVFVCLCSCLFTRACEVTQIRLHAQALARAHKHTGTLTDRHYTQTDKQTDRQTDTHTHTHVQVADLQHCRIPK